MTLASDIAQIDADTSTLHQIVHGAPTTDVVTEAGPIPSLAKAIATVISGPARGAWATATSYALGDMVTNAGLTYRCVLAHTSGSFSTDLSAVKWTINFGGITPALAAVVTQPTTALARDAIGLFTEISAADGSDLVGYQPETGSPTTVQDHLRTVDDAILRIGASMGIYLSTTEAMSNGVSGITLLAAGSGGTNGTFALAFSGGGGSYAAGTFTVAGGVVVNVSITRPGVSYTSAPTVSFAASSGLAGASAACAISQNVPPSYYFSVPVAGDPASLILYRNVGGTATEITRYPSVSGAANPRPTSLADAGINRVIVPAGGFFNGGGGDTTGAFKIKLPIGAPARNVVIDIVVMDNYGFMKLTICGFNNVGVWNYTAATIVGQHQFQPQPNIRWGNDGTSDCIWIGDLAVNYWAYPKVWIDRVMVGDNGPEVWASGWAISLVTAYDTITAGPTLATRPMDSNNPTFSGTLNAGVVNFPVSAGGTYLGYQAHADNASPAGSYNTLVGYQCGKALSTGYNNTFGGLQTGAECVDGYANSGWGLQVLQHLTSGSFNAAYSIHALLSLTTGQSNNAFGAGAMEYLTAGSANNALGMYAGRDTQGSGNLFLGNHAGINTNTSDELFIANSETQQLIRGKFVLGRLWVCGGSDDGVNGFQVNGTIRFRPAAASTPVSNGDLTFEATSDTSLRIRFKGSDGVVRSAVLALAP